MPRAVPRAVPRADPIPALPRCAAQVFGHITFIGELYKEELLAEKVMVCGVCWS